MSPNTTNKFEAFKTKRLVFAVISIASGKSQSSLAGKEADVTFVEFDLYKILTV